MENNSIMSLMQGIKDITNNINEPKNDDVGPVDIFFLKKRIYELRKLASDRVRLSHPKAKEIDSVFIETLNNLSDFIEEEVKCL